MAPGEKFSLGAVVVPVLNSSFYSLNLKFPSGGYEHLGVVIEAATKKSKVLFPVENLCLWLEHEDLSDLDFLDSVKNPLPSNEQWQSVLSQNSLTYENLVFVYSYLIRFFQAKTVVGFEIGRTLKDVWNTPDWQDPEGLAPINSSYDCLYWGITVGEIFLAKIQKIEKQLGHHLICFRIIPASLSKIEISFFIKLKK